MITPDYAQMMARYSAWQNRSLYAAAATLDDAARRRDRGAFFGSIHGTLSHLLWADRTWLARFRSTPPPPVGIPGSAALYGEWAELARERLAFDAEIEAWARSLDATWLTSDLTWFSGAAAREVTRPRWQLVVHLFNHQTHHRGQVHAMLTAAGARPDATDLPFLAED